MLTMFTARERAFEAKFAHDEEFRYLTAARRDKLFARWAARTLRLRPNETEALVSAVLVIPDGPGHDHALLEHVGGLLAAQRTIPEQDLSATLTTCGQTARQQLLGLLVGQSDPA